LTKLLRNKRKKDRRTKNAVYARTLEVQDEGDGDNEEAGVRGFQLVSAVGAQGIHEVT
jgi:hypothetical protein